MHADFSSAAKAARAQLVVPAIDVEAIRNRSQADGIRARLRRLVVACAFALGAIGAGVAFAANTGGVRVWLLGGKMAAIEIQSFAMARSPMADDLRKIADSATFPVVWPAGLPAGSRIGWVIYTPADHPDFLSISYRDRSGHSLTSVSIIDSRFVETDKALLPKDAHVVTGPSPYVWHAGGETVFMSKAYHPASAVAAIRSAMLRMAPAASLALNMSFAATIETETGAWDFVNAAERLAPVDSVLLSPAQIGQMARLAGQDRPLLDNRTVILRHIPFKNGKPDYANAILDFPRDDIALPPAGVRAVSLALNRGNVTHKCGCAVLVHPSNRGYAIWKVDAKTGKATAL